jgi:SAM-dependent methyltransferase
VIDLPYFDDILGRSADSAFARSIRRHVHWGYFASPGTAEPTEAGFLAAAEAMTTRMCEAAGAKDGLRILDVGCGFGGTIAHLNERVSGCDLVGLNIDARQLERARQTVQAARGNTVRFVEGDACAIPLADGAFDAVTAVECVFHFPSRKSFLGEARRVLRPGGTLAVSDFVANDGSVDAMGAWLEENPSAQGTFFGSTKPAIGRSTYARLARATGFDLVADDDITAETMPTYPWLKKLWGDAGGAEAVKSLAFLEETARRGFLEYRIMSFRAKG